jgi:hypothetical protein
MKLTSIFAGRVGNYRTCFWLLFALVACAASASGQVPPRVVVEASFPPNQPVELVGAEVAGGMHNFALEKTGYYTAAFDAPEGWLRHLTLKLRNKTDKTILGVTLNGSLAVGEEGEIPMGFDLFFGQEPDESAFTGRAPRGVPGSLAPSQTGDVRWSEAEYAQLEKFLSTKHPVASYRKMSVFLRDVRFADGTVWTLNGLFRIDPLDPRKWTPVDKQANASAAGPPLKAGERIVEDSSSKPDSDQDVIVITGIEVAGRQVTPGQPFAAGDDWLRGLTLRFKNISSKPITYVQLGLSFPEAHYHNGGIGHSLRYGRNMAEGAPHAPDAKLLSPGEEAEVIFTDGEFHTFRTFAEKLNGSADFHRLRLGIASVKFADGTRAMVINPARTLKPSPPAMKSN